MGKLLLLIAGVVSLVAAVPLLFVGTGMMWVDVALTDEAGFITSSPMDAEVDGYALVAAPESVELGPDLVLRPSNLVSLRWTAEGAAGTPEAFLGVGPRDLVDAYLRGTPYAVAEEIEGNEFLLTYRMPSEDGVALASPPAEQSFWIASTSGSGRQELLWDVNASDVAFVLMNADASDGMSFEITLAARVAILRPVASAFLLGGAAALLAGAVLTALAL
ncbi:MAG: hypothetical protein AB1778_05240 [Candidatus Bipolaricaulota bacterium]